MNLEQNLSITVEIDKIVECSDIIDRAGVKFVKVTDTHFEKIYNKKVLRKLHKKFGPFCEQHVDLSIDTPWMTNLVGKMSRKRRRGEVVLVIPDKRRHIWLHTKAFYGDNIYRLMTGGLNPGEKPHMACRREMREETGFKVDIDRCLAVVTYSLSIPDQTRPFVSYVFSTKRVSGQPNPTDESEAIAGFKKIPIAELNVIADELESLEGERADWGTFRAVAHRVAQKQLQAE